MHAALTPRIASGFPLLETAGSDLHPEFKAEAVPLALTSGKTITEVARELDLTVTCLHDWVRQAGIDAKRELRTVEQERDF
jgi:transposase-like protein